MNVRHPLLCAFGLTLAAVPAAHAQDADDAPLQIARDLDDGDGVPASADACPTTPAGLAPLVRGCAAAELVRDPSPLLRGPSDEALALRNSVAGQRAYGDVETAVNAGLAAFAAADQAVRAGDACGAALSLRDAVERLNEAGEAATRAELWIRAGISAVRPEVRGATEDQQEIDAAGAGMRAAALRAVADRAVRESLPGVERLCEAIVGSDRVHAAVDAIDDATGLATLAGMRQVVLADGLPEGAGLPGIAMDYDVDRFADGSGVVVAAGGFLPLPPDVLKLPCAQLAVEPVEPHAPYVNHSITWHSLDDYYWEKPFSYGEQENGGDGPQDGEGDVYLEKGMRIGFSGVECDDGADRGATTEYFHTIKAFYVSKYDGMKKSRTMGHAVRAGGTPVDFPDDASPGAPVTLEFTGWHRTCTGAVPFTCVAQEDYFSDLDVRLLERGDLCQAVYDDTGFPPVAPGGFQVAHVVTTKSPDYIVGDYDFLAKGRRVYNGVATANAVSLGEGDEFAIGNPDIYDPDGFLQTEFYGVDRAAGLVWPRIRAKSGRWQYSCRLPGVSHDELAECPGLGSMGYKLPFDASDPQWWLGQGNNGTFTHKGSQAYAFDFGAKAGTDILAARAGEVVFVRNDQDGNSYDDPSCTNCKPNMVQIRHEDGTFGSYFHMPQNGVTVVVGQHVERGQVLGQVGNTGYSTGPHVHFHVTPTQWSDSTPVAFEVREPISVKGGWKAGDVQSCVVPASNTKVFSTNTRP